MISIGARSVLALCSQRLAENICGRLPRHLTMSPDENTGPASLSVRVILGHLVTQGGLNQGTETDASHADLEPFRLPVRR